MQARLQAERAEIAKAAAEAEKQSVEEKKQAEKQAAEAVATKNAVETLRNGVPKLLDYSKETHGQVVATGFDDKKQVSLSGIWGPCYVDKEDFSFFFPLF